MGNEAEGMVHNDNDTTIPTSAAVKDYVDSLDRDDDLNIAGASGTGTVDLDYSIINSHRYSKRS